MSFSKSKIQLCTRHRIVKPNQIYYFASMEDPNTWAFYNTLVLYKITSSSLLIIPSMYALSRRNLFYLEFSIFFNYCFIITE